MEFLPDSDALSSATSAKWECGSNTAPVVKQNSSIARNCAPEENETDGDKFEFDESFDELTQSSLVSALMAGLYYIPPERILRHQMGWGRRIRYDAYNHVQPAWKALRMPELLGGAFDWVEFAELERVVLDAKSGQRAKGTFRIYRAKLAGSLINSYIDDIESKGLLEQLNDKKGISVSNAGGYHSKVVNAIAVDTNNDSTGLLDSTLGSNVMQYLELIECHDRDSAAAKAGGKLPTRSISGLGARSEGWINISGHGAFNRLHTHEGAAWSAVLYIKDIDPDMSACQYSGNLLLKPSPHSSESMYQMTETECERLNFQPLNDFQQNQDNSLGHKNLAVCDYVSIPADRGVLFVMPGWLHHCVMPVAVKKEFRSCGNGANVDACVDETNGCGDPTKRISLAMNFNAAS